jgi:hypothetical protein
MLRLVALEMRHLTAVVSYWIRPYDVLADARRWRWQPRYPCQFGDGLRAVLARWEDETK